MRARQFFGGADAGQDVLKPKLPTPLVSVVILGVFAVLLAGGLHDAVLGKDAQKAGPQLVLGHGAKGVAFVDNSVCKGCHEAEYAEWQTSHHAHSMERATPASVRGNFDKVGLVEDGKHARFYRHDDRYFSELEGMSGTIREFEVLYTFGYEPLQQYLVSLPGGRLQALTIAWDTKAKRWFSLLPGDHSKPGDPLHWTGRMHNWNSRCAECHSTNLQKNYDANTDRFNTRFSAVNVSCQACHGPGAAHVEWARGPRKKDTGNGLVVVKTGTESTQAGNTDSRGEVCDRCHSRRYRLTINDQHDRSFFDQFAPVTLRAGFYHPDGQIDDEVFVYGSFIQSKMHRAGVRCADCHNAHTGRVHTVGNALCTSCHNKQPPERFPGLKPKIYDAPAHHHHEPQSAGAQCVNCHMPAKTYMVVDPRRDHQFSIPRPDLSEKIGTPNACTGCHTDKKNAWAVDHLSVWLGQASPQKPHYGEAIAAGRRRDPQALPALASLVGDATASGVVRATAAELLGDYGVAATQPLISALRDKDHLVRANAIESLGYLPSRNKIELFTRLLADPFRLVRLNAARELATVPRNLIPKTYRDALDAGLKEFIEAQQAAAETPEAQVNLGRLYADLGERKKAIEAYERAIKMAPEHGSAYFQFATLLSAIDNNQRAEAILRKAVQRIPDYADGYYALGLLLAETNRLDKAEAMLAKATAIDPRHANALYNHGLLLMSLKRPKAAETVLLKAYKVSPGSEQPLRALIILLIQERRYAEAEARANELVLAFPKSSGARQMLQRVKKWRKDR